MARMVELVEAVKAHAIENYDSGQGWDHVVEAMDDAEIAKILWGNKELGERRSLSPKGAIRRMRDVVVLYAEARDEAIGAGGEVKAKAKVA